MKCNRRDALVGVGTLKTYRRTWLTTHQTALCGL
jgi:hypothetical protein